MRRAEREKLKTEQRERERERQRQRQRQRVKNGTVRERIEQREKNGTEKIKEKGEWNSDREENGGEMKKRGRERSR